MFYALTQDNVLDYIKTRPVFESFLARAQDLKAIDLAAGNINLIFRVYAESDPLNKSVILKQALPYAWRYPDFKMPQSRAVKEWEVLLLENKYCPGLAPRVYEFDRDMYVNILEDCNRHLIMRQGLMKQVIYPRFAKDIGIFLARTLFYTSNFFLPSDKVKEAAVNYSNPVMCKVTEDLVFTEPYRHNSNNHYTHALEAHVGDIYADDCLYSEVLEMKEAFMTHAEALVHGDLHTGSILINPEQTIVIDPEFAFYGPMSFDIGAVLGNLLLSYVSQAYHAPDEEKRSSYQAWLMETFCEVWRVFNQEFCRLWDVEPVRQQWPAEGYRTKFLQQVLQDTAGMAACKAMRRILGMAHVPDLESIPDEQVRARAESLALNASISWIKNRREVVSIDDLVELVRQARPHPAVA
jgi:5-methylthioribose kinase